ncbi:MAG: single-stranded DNA-binding protein [Candidatus Staskawiczbacteria bacterium]|jgi:single-strand DNA-binding protein
MNLNKAFVLGNVTRDPEVRSLPSGQQVTNFSIATNRFYTSGAGEKKQEVEFHNVVCFGKLADISSRYLNKGSLVLIEGRIKTRNWMNAQGVKQYKTEIIAETMQLGPKGASGSGPSDSSNYGKSSFKGPEPEQDLPAQAGEIPVIEENYNLPSDNNAAADEIDVKDIPF